MKNPLPDYLEGSTLDTTSLWLKFKRAIQCLLTDVSPRLNIRVLFWHHFKRIPNLKAPRDLNEKVAVMKLTVFRQDPLIKRCADKHEVKKYLDELGYGHLCIKTLRVYERVEDIEWDALPDKCMIKWNFAYGMNVFVKDKGTLDIPAVEKQLRDWEKVDYWKLLAETQYEGIPKRIICEEYIESENGLEDYKVYCFHGKPMFFMLCVGRRYGKPSYFYYDTDWNLMYISKHYAPGDQVGPHPRPPQLEKMVEYARELSKPFEYVRVDFYDTGSEVYFGEFTFTPFGGLDNDKSQEGLDMLGDML